MQHIHTKILSFCVLSLFLTNLALAETKLRKVEIQGNQRIESDTILSYLPIKAGDAIDQSKLDHALKELFATGYFNDVNVHAQGDVVYVKVDENPIINRIAYEGNEKLKDDVIKEELRLRPREVLSRTKVQEAQQRLLEIYRRMGRFGAKVEPKIIRLPENRVDLVFEINEGAVTYVRKINFIGNKRFERKRLEECLQTKRTKWYRFFAVDDVYDPDRFISDQQALRQFYNNHGFADFRIVSAVAELSGDQKDFYLTFTLEEGDVFTFGSVDFDSKLPNIDTSKLNEAVSFAKGETYSARMVERTQQAIVNVLGAQGYAFVSVEPRLDKDRNNKVVNITFEIKEGPRVYIEKIVFIGNDRTRDYVIRREIEIHEGDAYNATKVKNAERNLKDINYFKTVSVDTEPGSAPDQAKLIVKVEEQSTGELQLAGGYSTMDGPLASIRVVERNFKGTGQILHTDLTIAKKKQDFDVGIVKPYLFDRNLTGSADVFHSRSSRFSAYTHTSKGINLGVSYRLSERWSQSWSYGLKHDSIGHVAATASPYLQKQKGNFYTSQLGHTITYDRRDSRLSPRSGYLLSLSNTYAGLGGNVQYLRNDLGANWYYPVGDESVFGLKGAYGRIERVRRKIRIVDSVFLGADSLRGFEYGGLGPRDKKTDDALGGTRYWTTTAETIFPIGLPNEFGIKGAVFTDWGTTWRPSEGGPNIVDTKKPRGSVGIGLAMNLPIGPLRIDYAIPIKKEKHDQTQRILFGFSTNF
jgi:outer membrane protein insertion porin family